MAQGYVSHIDNKRQYGFIDSPELLLDHIFFHFTNCKKPYKHIIKGDKVNFELNSNGEKGNEAVNVSFVRNASLDQLKKDFENKIPLKGFLKKIDDAYYVKDRETYIFLSLLIAKSEINVKEVYEDNLNTLIDYKIVTFSQKNKIRAVNINRQFMPERVWLVQGNKTEGLVVAVVKGGYQIKTLNNILGFLPNSLVLRSKGVLELGESIQVTCIKANDDLEGIVFNLTENMDTDNGR
jgi:cold shock CspA family protein